MITFFFACEKLLLGEDPADEPVENFELFWKTLDEKYAFFDFKEIDWDAVYNEYRPHETLRSGRRFVQQPPDALPRAQSPQADTGITRWSASR